MLNQHNASATLVLVQRHGLLCSRLGVLNPKQISSFETELFGSHPSSFDGILKSSPSKASWIGFGMERGHQFQFWAMSLGSDLLASNSERCNLKQISEKKLCDDYGSNDLKLFAIKTNHVSALANFQPYHLVILQLIQ